jgi:peptidoglycan/LPS O-acetylase OafA/YrhL
MENERYVVLDGLRGLAALAIAIHHFTQDAGHGEVFASASIAVDFFFCLSGFVIAHAYHNRLSAGMGLREYVFKRVTRLYPMYLVGLLLGLLSVLLLKEQKLTSLTGDLIAKAVILNLFYVPFPNWEYVQAFNERIRGAIFPLNNPAWSLFFGMVANIVYAASLRVSQRAPLILAAVSGISLVIAAITFGSAPGWGVRNFIGGFPRVFFAFFAGVVIFQYYPRTAGLPRVNGWLIAAVVAGLFLVPHFPLHRWYWLLAALFVMPLAVAIASRSTFERGSRSRRLATYAGQISYPVFCVHYPILILFSLLPRDNSKMTLLSLTFLDFLSIAVGFFFTTLVVSQFLLTRVEVPLRDSLGALLSRLQQTRL